MILNPLKLPMAVCEILGSSETVEVIIDEDISHRPDRIPEMINTRSIKMELINNYMSCKSPISVEKGKHYTVCLTSFEKNFGRQ